MIDDQKLDERQASVAQAPAESSASVEDVARRLLVRAKHMPRRLPPAFGRGLDIAVALVALIFFGPAMVVIAIAIACERKGPVLFRHDRIGLNGRVFKVLKFRTMRVDGDEILARHLATDAEAAAEWGRDHKLRKDPRVSKLGGFLRKASLDELPQILNVLAGQMSIVGPRPIVQAEVVRYGKHFRQYCSVRPGITGIWQVSGRNDVTYRRRVLMDALYSRRKSVALDLKIMLATLPAVIGRKGSY